MWLCCQVCTSEQNPNTKSVWNDKSSRKQGLERYMNSYKRGRIRQVGLAIKNCPAHKDIILVRPQDEDARREELRKFRQSREESIGGIVDNELRTEL